MDSEKNTNTRRISNPKISVNKKKYQVENIREISLKKSNDNNHHISLKKASCCLVNTKL